MARIEEFVARRREIAAAYDAAFAELPVTTPWQHPDTASAWHLYVIRIDRQRTSRSHREIFDSLREAGIGVNLHYIPVYRQPYYRELGFGQGHCPNAEAYYAEAISLPMYFGLSDDEQRQVVTAVAEAVAA
jgi:dTDP-4-amino-4,6-dideoxygalactose transaminase